MLPLPDITETKAALRQHVCVFVSLCVPDCALRDKLALQERMLNTAISRKTHSLQFHIIVCVTLTVCVKYKQTVLGIDTVLCCFGQPWPLYHLMSNWYFQVCNSFTVSAAADINECQQRSVCTNGHCRNTEGSFRCICSQGYSLSSSGDQCEGKLRESKLIFFNKILNIYSILSWGPAS